MLAELMLTAANRNESWFPCEAFHLISFKRKEYHINPGCGREKHGLAARGKIQSPAELNSEKRLVGDPT